jgi:Sec-independent protein translocase protein TatA
MTDVTPEAQAEPTTPEAAPAPVEGQESPQLGIDPALDARLNELGQSIGQLTQGFQQMQESQYEDPYQDPYQQQQQDPYNGLDPNDPRDAQILQMQQGYQQLQQQTENMAQEAYARDLQGLTQRIPELDKPEVAGPVVDQAKQLMHQLGQDPNGRIPVGLIETVYGKYRADQIAAGQQPLSQVQQGQATLEGAGASPQQPEQDPLDQYFPAQNAEPTNVFGIRR